MEWNQLFNWSDGNFAFGNLTLNNQRQNYFSSLNYHRFEDAYSIKAGVVWDYDKSKLNGTFPIFNFAMRPDHPTVAYDTLQTVHTPEAFLYLKWNQNAWGIGGGMRYHPDWFNFSAWWSHQLNVRWSISDTHALLLSAGKYHKANLDSENIFATQSHHYAIEYLYEKKEWKWTSSLYYKRTTLQNTINPIAGLELFAAYKKRNLNARLSFAHIHSMLENEESRYPSNYDFDYFIRLMLQYSLPNICEISMVYLHRQGQYFQSLRDTRFHELTNTWQPLFVDPANAQRLPTYQLLDISISRIMPLGAGSLVVFLSANNVLNIKNVRGYEYNFDYTQQEESLYNQRVVFMGGVWSF